MRGLLPVDVAFAPAPASIAMGLALGAWVAGLFSLLPLLAIRDVPALAVLRRAFEAPARGRRDWLRLAAVLVLVLSIVGLSVLQAPSPVAGIAFAASIGIALGVLWGVAVLLMWTVRRLFPTRWPYVWRQGLANLYRPANQTAMVILALGFGAFLLDTVYLVQHNLLRDLRVGGTQDRPNLALFDIQPDQREGLRALLQREGLHVDTPVPIVPMRISSLKGRAAGAVWPKAPRPRKGRLGADRPIDGPCGVNTAAPIATLSARPSAWWPARPGPRAPGSPRTPRASRCPSPSRRDSPRKWASAWATSSPGTCRAWPSPAAWPACAKWNGRASSRTSSSSFPEGPLDSAPQTFLTLTRVSDPTHRARLQRSVAEAFPNVTALDLAQVQEVIEKVIARVSLAIRFMALFSLAAGVIVLLGRSRPAGTSASARACSSRHSGPRARRWRGSSSPNT